MTDTNVVSRLRAQAQQGNLSDDAAIVFRMTGGVGDDALEESMILTGAGGLQIRSRDRSGRKPLGEVRTDIGRAEALELYRLLLQGIDSMVPASQARFVPDTLVAAVTLGLGNDVETFYFAADEEDHERRGQPLKPEIRRILYRVRQIEVAHLAGPRGTRGQDQGSK
jgi:hypothetical protein